MWHISAHSIGTKASYAHLSFVASRWGHPMGRVWFFSHSIETKSFLDNWFVFLQDGVTLFESESNVLISSEGITTVGLLGAFFWPVLGGEFLSSFGRPVGSEAGRVPHSVVSASGEDSVGIPLANEGVGLGLSSSSGPVASRPPLADRSTSAASSTPVASPGILRCCWVLFNGCRPGWFRWVAIFRDHVPSLVGYMEWVSCEGPFHLLALYGVDCGFSALAPPLRGVSPFLHQGLSLDVVCGVPLPPPCHIVTPCP